MTPQAFATAIGIVESNGNPNAPLGDGGRAIGRFQMHPDEMWTWARRLSIAPAANETWDSFIGRIVQAFYTFHCSEALTDVQIAMTYHIGHILRENSPEWDLGYAEKFSNAARGLTTT